MRTATQRTHSERAEGLARWAFFTMFSGVVAVYFLYPFVQLLRDDEFHWSIGEILGTLVGGAVPAFIGIMSLVAMVFSLSCLIKHLFGRAEDSDFD